MENEITIATANAYRGKLFKEKGGLDPLKQADVLLLQEVAPKRDQLDTKLSANGFKLVHTDQDNVDLAIAVREGFDVESNREEFLTRSGSLKRLFSRNRMGGLFRRRSMIITTIITPSGEKLDVATLHPVIPLKVFARRAQIQKMGSILKNHSRRIVIGADFNHYPQANKVDEQVRRDIGLNTVDIGNQSTYSSKKPWLRKFFHRRKPQLDAMLYGGSGIEPKETQVVPINSDHKAIITKFLLKPLQNH